MSPGQTDPVKQLVAAHWNRRVAHFDEDFGHGIRSAHERAAWERTLDLILPAVGGLEALDIGCGTGFLSFQLASRGHRVIGIDFAPLMIAEAQKKATERQLAIRFEEADAEQLPFTDASFDIAVSRHLLWTLPNPERAMDEWVRVLRPGARLIVIDSQADVSASPEPLDKARKSPEYTAIGDRLPFVAGWPCEEVENLFAAHGLVNIVSDPLLDLVAAEQQRSEEERRVRRRYAVWGEVPP
ncbi:MAG: class I SAM-dependent methyltransferase [Alphaproteobacteria bacterium]|nr:class I SAM-dependent methyltransferase [Alphaproteobacteria bacterium]